VSLLQDPQLLSRVIQRSASTARREFPQYAPVLISEGRPNPSAEQELETFLESLARCQMSMMAVMDLARQTFGFNPDESFLLVEKLTAELARQEMEQNPPAEVVPIRKTIH
jgi:hypothetical protein